MYHFIFNCKGLAARISTLVRPANFTAPFCLGLVVYSFGCAKMEGVQQQIEGFKEEGRVYAQSKADDLYVVRTFATYIPSAAAFAVAPRDDEEAADRFLDEERVDYRSDRKLFDVSVRMFDSEVFRHRERDWEEVGLQPYADARFGERLRNHRMSRLQRQALAWRALVAKRWEQDGRKLQSERDREEAETLPMFAGLSTEEIDEMRGTLRIPPPERGGPEPTYIDEPLAREWGRVLGLEAADLRRGSSGEALGLDSSPDASRPLRWRKAGDMGVGPVRLLGLAPPRGQRSCASCHLPLRLGGVSTPAGSTRGKPATLPGLHGARRPHVAAMER